ncbi:MAG: M1 family metallopeptidase [Planctomycetota bacterium]
MVQTSILALLGGLLLLASCVSDGGSAAPSPAVARDEHSRSRPEEARSRHLELDLRVDFAARRIEGTARHRIVRRDATAPGDLVLDVKDLEVRAVRAGRGEAARAASWTLEPGDPRLGDGLRIPLEAGEDTVEVDYATTDGGTGLQWLEPAQTAGGTRPFLFSQSQAIHARTWIPCQDSPGVRITYDAVVTVPADLTAVMSAGSGGAPEAVAGGARRFRFAMPQAIPSYLIALAVGQLEFRAMSDRTGVWAEPSVVERAAWEFADTESMVRTAEGLYGPYRWGRYDILVLPPSFPFGGMENPRLTFVTPTVLAGDRSLVALIAHELAHSWSGNLVTNATHRDFWLNEGFTVYFEHRIMEAVYGRERFEMECMLGIRDLEEEMAEMEPRDQVLHVDLAGRDPDEGFTGVPYDKGAGLLRRLEQVFGRERFDAFLRAYFDRFSFTSITTATFRDYLERELLAADPERAAEVDLDLWIEGPGLPPDFPRVVSDAFERIDRSVADWRAGRIELAAFGRERWTTQEWLHFIGRLDPVADRGRLPELERTFALTASGNNEILCAWLELAVRADYGPADARLAGFLKEQGRRKFLTPLYRALLERPGGRERAAAIYREARPRYHAIARDSIDALLDWRG